MNPTNNNNTFVKADTVRVFWDIENMPVSKNVAPGKFFNKLYATVRLLGKAVDRVTAFCNPASLKDTMKKAMLQSGITIEPVRGDKAISRRETCDRALEQDVLFWLLDQERNREDPTKSCVVIITSDNDFALLINKLINRGYNIVTILNKSADKQALGKVSAHKIYWEDLEKDVVTAATTTATTNNSNTATGSTIAAVAGIEEATDNGKAISDDETEDSNDDQIVALDNKLLSVPILNRETSLSTEERYGNAVEDILKSKFSLDDENAKGIDLKALRDAARDIVGSGRFLGNKSSSNEEGEWLKSLPFVKESRGTFFYKPLSPVEEALSPTLTWTPSDLKVEQEDLRDFLQSDIDKLVFHFLDRLTQEDVPVETVKKHCNRTATLFGIPDHDCESVFNEVSFRLLNNEPKIQLVNDSFRCIH